VFAYPRITASYTVPVRQYRILQSVFALSSIANNLHCMGHPKPAFRQLAIAVSLSIQKACFLAIER